jgi:lipoprotein-releasing system permease protein
VPPEVLSQLNSGAWTIILGSELARQLQVKTGDKVTIMAPGGQVTPAGVIPRLKQLTVVGTFSSGHYEYDSALAMMHLDDAAKLFRLAGPTGVQLRLKDLNLAPTVAEQLRPFLDFRLQVRDWTQANPQWYAAVQLEKRMMFIILTLIVAVAVFNLVSTLVMVVTDKQADIAILRTLGASPTSIMMVFMFQGALSGFVGTFLGVVFGLLGAFYIGNIVAVIEWVFNTSFVPSSVYMLGYMPTDPQVSDVVPITLIALLLAFVATLYPSFRASRVQPARALRYE